MSYILYKDQLILTRVQYDLLGLKVDKVQRSFPFEHFPTSSSS